METVTDGRRQRSLRSRAQIVGAAERLFLERGYVRTTIEDIADAAGVAVQTVYYVFGTKLRVLAAVLDARIGGDDPSPVVERDWVASLGATGGPADAIDALVAAAVDILSRAAPVYEVVRRAASDPEIGELLAANRQSRRADQRVLIQRLHETGAFAEDLDVEAAADSFYALVNEEVFQLLVVDCGWTTDRFRAWLADLVHTMLLPPASTRPAPSGP
jgi:AcrR family transcriptional regulator